MIGLVIKRLKAGLSVSHFSARIVAEARRQLKATVSSSGRRRNDRSDRKSEPDTNGTRTPKRVFDFSHLAALSKEITQHEIEAGWVDAFATVAAEKTRSVDPIATSWDRAMLKAAPAVYRQTDKHKRKSLTSLEPIKVGRRGDPR